MPEPQLRLKPNHTYEYTHFLRSGKGVGVGEGVRVACRPAPAAKTAHNATRTGLRSRTGPKNGQQCHQHGTAVPLRRHYGLKMPPLPSSSPSAGTFLGVFVPAAVLEFLGRNVWGRFRSRSRAFSFRTKGFQNVRNGNLVYYCFVGTVVHGDGGGAGSVRVSAATPRSGRRLTADSSLLRSQGPVTVVKHTPSSPAGTAAFPPARVR